MITKTILLKIKEPDTLRFEALRKEYATACNMGITYLSSIWPTKVKHSGLYSHLKTQTSLPSSVFNEAVRLVRFRWITFCKQKKQHIKTSTPHFKNTIAISFNNQNWIVKKTGNIYFIGFPVNGSKPYFGLALSQKQKDVLDKLLLNQIQPCVGQLLKRKDKWYFVATINFPEPKQISDTNVLGVDLGLNNLALKLKAGVINLENLKHIRTTAKTNHKQRQKLGSTLHNWPFDQIKQFIEYKAREQGILLNLIDPAYTSQECPVCHYISLSNRTGILFHCRACGYKTHADRVGAINISNRQPVPLVTDGMPEIVYPSRDGLSDTALNLRIAQTRNGPRTIIT